MKDETWDLRDRDGDLIGATHRRGDPLPEGRFHTVASVCAVRDDGRVLLTRRAIGKTYALAWEIPAGSALSGESSVEAGVRELREETGIAVDAEAMVLVDRFIEESALFDFYVVPAPRDATVTPDPEEVCDFEWATLDDVDARVADGTLADPWLPRLEAFSDPLRMRVEALAR